MADLMVDYRIGSANPSDVGSEPLVGKQRIRRRSALVEALSWACSSRPPSRPIRCLTEWRMHLANELLATTELSIFAIARQAGYDSEEAFSRAFKRECGLSPTHWRASHGSTPRSGSNAS